MEVILHVLVFFFRRFCWFVGLSEEDDVFVFGLHALGLAVLVRHFPASIVNRLSDLRTVSQVSAMVITILSLLFSPLLAVDTSPIPTRHQDRSASNAVNVCSWHLTPWHRCLKVFGKIDFQSSRSCNPELWSPSVNFYVFFVFLFFLLPLVSEARRGWNVFYPFCFLWCGASSMEDLALLTRAACCMLHFSKIPRGEICTLTDCPLPW